MDSREFQKLLQAGEREDVDFKRDPSGVSADDFVAFANSGSPSLILVGVYEQADESGKQIGHLVGCDVGDGTQLLLTNKAQSCHPPVKIAIDVFHDKASSKAALILSIPTSEARPHCTPKGAYLTRHGTRNVPVLPQELLAIFLENESNAFAKRFADATEHMSENLAATVEEIQQLKSDVSSRIEDISSQMSLSDMTLDDTESLLRTLIRESRELREKVSDADERMKQVVQDSGHEDRLRQRKRTELKNIIKEGLSEKIDSLEEALAVKSFEYTVGQRYADEFDDNARSEIAHEAFAELLAELKEEQGKKDDGEPKE